MLHPNALPEVRLTGARVLQNDHLQALSLCLANGRIVGLSRSDIPQNGSEIDLSGYVVLPGIVDLHGALCGRQTLSHDASNATLAEAIEETARDAARCGITTGWISQGWSWSGRDLSPSFAHRLLAVLGQIRKSLPVDLRPQLMVETHATNTGDLLLEEVRQHGVDFVLFRNSLGSIFGEPHHKPDFVADNDRADAARGRRREVPRFLCRMADAFDALGLRYGSFADPDGITRENYAMMGARLCMLPGASSSARIAKAVGDPVLLSAIRLLPQRTGFESMTEMLVRVGHCDALVSESCREDLGIAAFALADDDILPMGEAWALVSHKPAALLGLKDRGHIAEGLRADLVIVREKDRRIEATISGGRLVHASGDAGRKLAIITASKTLVAAE
ncbi:alkylphosphonate utilization protein [Aestuariibius sp. 2305UL40-4]|uniref:alkylphosphonate utilization protein n=1 Tax=Aestuariibius violaceus TaxID=3234132 RepID=UPI00345E6BCE